MELMEKVDLMIERVLQWFESMRVPQHGFGVFTNSEYNRHIKYPGMLLPATYNAVNCLVLLGAYNNLTPVQADEIAAFLNSFQLENGFYRVTGMHESEIYYPTFEYIDLHTTNYTLGALANINRRPRLPFAFMERYNSSEKLEEWLSRRDMQKPWVEGNYVVNLASFYIYLLEQGEYKYRELINLMFDWHEKNQDPASGYWYDPTTKDLTSAMAGASHNFHLYYYFNKPVSYYDRVVDHCLGILDNEVSIACLDIDVVDILSNFYRYGYRQKAIESYLARKLVCLLDYQNDDGGFCDTRCGIRYFDGWEAYREPQGLSNCFATWFRCATVGMICRILFPEKASRWRFRNTIGMGYYPVLTSPHGGISQE